MSKKARFQAEILGITLNSTPENEVLREIMKRIRKNKKTFIVTPNPEFIVYAQKNPWFKKILIQADFAVPDGIGLTWAGKILGQSIKERISGTDLMEKLCQEADKHYWSVYLLGGRPEVAKKTLAVLKKRYSGLKGWAESGPKLNLQPITYNLSPKKEITRAIKSINSKNPDFLFIAFGMGKQEKFIWDNWDKLDVKLAVGVGGAFDYLSGKVPRAPKWVRNLGLEWLFRLIKESWRWRRQLALLEFIWLVIKEKFSS